MEYKRQDPSARTSPRLIIHGGAGNIQPATLPPGKYAAYREALLTIVHIMQLLWCGHLANLTQVGKAHTYMTTPLKPSVTSQLLPPALETATYAVTLLEDNPLFNSGHGAVFTRDGTNELEASVMVSRGFAKRGVGVTGLRRVRNPILLARAILEHGDEDLGGRDTGHPSAAGVASPDVRTCDADDEGGQDGGMPPGNAGASGLDVPSAQGHTLICGEAAEILAEKYGLSLVKPEYFFTQTRWDEHVRALERERTGRVTGATWCADEYLPQGTVGAVALDSEGVVCAATSTGGMTNKLSGRIGDTPVVGAGFWAEEWAEDGAPGRVDGDSAVSPLRRVNGALSQQGPAIALSESLKALMADCFPTPFVYTPVSEQDHRHGLTTTRSIAVSGTGNGDSFMRIAAVRTVAAIARYSGATSAEALRRVAGRGGELEKSAGARWGTTGEGQGGMIGVACEVVRDAEGNVVDTTGEILQDFNCGGMFRAWIDDGGRPRAMVFREGESPSGSYTYGSLEKDASSCSEKSKVQLI